MKLLLALFVIGQVLMMASPDFMTKQSHGHECRSESTVITVELNGTGNFKDVKSAVDSADPGDTIILMEGEFSGNITIDKPLTVIGAGPDKTIINGHGGEFSLKITADDVFLSGLSVFNSSKGIELASHRSNLGDINATYNWNGLLITGGGYNNISNCNFNGNIVGIYISNTTHNRLTECNADYNYQYGIYTFYAEHNIFKGGGTSFNGDYGMYVYWFSDHNTIRDYQANNNSHGLYILDCDDIDIINVSCTGNGGDGLYAMVRGSELVNITAGKNALCGINLYHTENTSITDSLVYTNGEYGIKVRYSRNNEFKRNVMMGNYYGIKLGSTSKNNLVSANIFHDNFADIQCRDDGENIWNTSKSGNYWSDHNAIDKDGDGLLDSLYIIGIGGAPSDMKPLSSPPVDISQYDPLWEPDYSMMRDSDNDSYWDIEEIVFTSDPYNAVSIPDDWDGDDWNNTDEIDIGTDPRVAASYPKDNDGDGTFDTLDNDIDGDGVPNEKDLYPYDKGQWSIDLGDEDSVLDPDLAMLISFIMSVLLIFFYIIDRLE